jgi:hypothetical protein
MTAWVPPLSRPGSRAVLGAGLAVCGALCSLVLLFTVVGQPSSPSPSDSVNTSQVPAAYLPWVLSAGSLCAVITPAVIAAQDQVESGWNPRAVSPAGAEGIAQFLPGTFATWGQDSDGTGNVSPFDAADAIMAQGRYDCSLASLMSALEGAGQVSGDVLSLALASYNAGLNDNPGTAAVRYMVLAHTAHALAEVPAYAARPAEASALTRLATHAHLHAERLHATAERLFLQSGTATAYKDGQADDGARIIAREYNGWSRTYPPVKAALDRKFYTEARQLAGAWDQVRRHALTEGPKQMAGMYQDLADAAYRFATNFPQEMPTSALPGLMQLAVHARKHAVRLEETARQWIDDGYRDLPDKVAATTRKARTSRSQPGLKDRELADERGSAAVGNRKDTREQSR